MIEQLQHVPDVLRVLYHEIQLHVEFTAYELHIKKNNNRNMFYNSWNILHILQCRQKKFHIIGLRVHPYTRDNNLK